jgi:heme-degrading monooxygenase HmoA
MFSVIFEVHPRREKFDLYLDLAKGLKPILEGIDGFIDNERFESSRRPGWILSHSTWRDEKSVVRWRTVGKHHDTQQRGRDEVFQDYHLRVGEIVADTAPSAGGAIVEQRLDETEIGRAKFVTLTEIQHISGMDRRSTSGVAVARSKSGGPDRLRRFCQYLQRGEARAAGVVARPALGGEIQPASLCRRPPSGRARRPRLRHVRSTREPSVLPRDPNRDGAAGREFLIAGHQEEPRF